MIKIIHVLTDTNIGGAGIWLLNFLRAFDRKKYDVVVAIPENSMLFEKVEALNIKAVEIPGIADCSYSKEGIKEFIKLFKKENPSIVHSHASLSARIAAKKLKIKTVNTRHCLEEKKPFLKRIIYSAINNSLSDIVIGVSKATCDNLIADGTKKKKVRLLYNGAFPPVEKTEEEIKEAKRKFGILETDTVVGIVARLESVKNHELFLRAIKGVIEKEDNVKALVVGDGSEKERLEELSKELGIENRVIFTGYQKDVSEVLNVIDINVLTSKNEALSLSLIEGMFLKKPAVTTKSGGPCEVVEDRVTGIIVNNYNEQELTDAILTLVRDKDLQKQMGENGKIRAREIFSVDKMIEGLDKIYHEILK